MTNHLLQLIQEGENQKVEFKRALFEFPRDAYETICAFLNSDGGTIIFGVEDDSTIAGVISERVSNFRDRISSDMNNPTIINPTVCLELKEKEIDGKTILYINVPQSSMVHRYNNRIYIRNDKSDNDVTDNQKIVSDLYLAKDTTYTENKIYPFLKIKDLRKDLIQRVKKLAKLNNEQSDWAELSNEQFLKRTSLYRQDFVNGKEGITLAGILFFGTDEQIASVVPAFKFDLIKQVQDTERYDDRLTLRTNLLDCFDMAMKFISNNLPAPFFMDGTRRINLRESIFRELIANMLVHKEYIGAEPTRLVIKRNKIVAENTSKPYRIGFITPENVTNHPKNPNIIKIFRGIGYVEELGSGISKMFKYFNEYVKHSPVIKDDTIFSLEVEHDLFPLDIKNEKQVNVATTAAEKSIVKDSCNNIDNQQISLFDSEYTHQVNKENHQVTHQVNKENHQVTLEKIILEFCVEPRSLREILDRVGMKDKRNFRKKYFNKLIETGMVSLTHPESLHSPVQKYFTTAKEKNAN